MCHIYITYDIYIYMYIHIIHRKRERKGDEGRVGWREREDGRNEARVRKEAEVKYVTISLCLW